MADEHKLSFTAAEIDEKLRKVDRIADETIKRLSDSGQIGYEEETLVVVIPENTADFVPMEDLGGLPVTMTSFDPTPGATYTIKWDGAEYVRVATAEGTVGNRGIAGEEDTGEPFIFITEGAIATTEGEHTFSLTEHRTVLHPVAKKWLPTIPTESQTFCFSPDINGFASLDDADYDFYDFANSGVLDFVATCQFAAGDWRGSVFRLRFSAVVFSDGKVAEYVSTFFEGYNDANVLRRGFLRIYPLSRQYNATTF